MAAWSISPATFSDVTSDFRKVCVDLDGYLTRLTGGGIVQMDLSQLIVDQRGTVSPEAVNIGTVVMQRFPRRALWRDRS